MSEETGFRGAPPSGERSERGQGPDPTVVALGASAGGLGALREFFDHVPENCGLAFVVVVHLSPDHESHLSAILQPHASMPIEQVTETVLLEPNRVYVIPPNRNLSTIDTHLRLSKLEENRRERAPIDHFFRTLAQTHDGHSVGVILSGTGADGTLGIKEIKARGGLVVVQDPNEAEYDGMPQSAIATGLVDLVLPIARIPAEILGYVRTQPQIPTARDEDVENDERQRLAKIFALVRARTDRDFSRYKRSTVMRRIKRRMQLRHVEELDRYIELVRDDAAEVRALADDFLITVTDFFRDPQVFKTLESRVIPQLFEERLPEQTVRVWSVGCATGEEAYSLAMLLLEEAERREAPPRIQVFASDLHERSLERAREGFYPGDIETDVTEARLERFFDKENGGYRIRKQVRDLVVFAPHNVLHDPPFSKLDLISCRNVLIYLQREVQREVIELFHYALRPSGFMLLGGSETVEGMELFRTEVKQHSLFRKRNVPAPEPKLPVFPGQFGRSLSIARSFDRSTVPLAYGGLHHRMVEHYGLPSMLVSPDDRIVHLSERAGRYLSMPGGELTTSAFKLVRAELRIELRAALHLARERKEPARSKPAELSLEGERRQVVLDVRPTLDREHDGFALVTFIDWAVAEGADAEAPQPSAEASTAERSAFEAELYVTKQRLQSIIEEYETSQEEMKASHEEMQSANEELRSTLEELETSKEELQSMNEELQTVNQENRHKVEELAMLSSDLQNLLAATEIATIFLDRQLRILRFTPKVSELFNVRTTDRGRPLSDITHRLGYGRLKEDAEAVLRQLAPIEREVQDDAGHWHLVRTRAYRSGDDRIEGVVITMVEITWRKESEDLREKGELLAMAAAASELGWVVWDTRTGKAEWDERGREILGLPADEMSPRDWIEHVHPDDRERVEAHLAQCMSTHRDYRLDYRITRPDGGARRVHGTGTFLYDEGKAVRGTGFLRDVTDA